MADSDDEYDRKRRDKFRGERTGGGGLGSGREERGLERRPRDDWPDREWSSRSRRGEYRDYRSGPGLGGGSRYSPGREPSSKRIRSDWGGGLDDRRYGASHDGYGSYGWAHDHYGHHPAHQSYPPHPSQGSGREGGLGSTSASDNQPSMMSFKAFLASQDDSITDEDAIRKYNEYKLDYRRQQLNEFFIAHKDEEWFKMKYHPEESLKRKEEQEASLQNRLNVFVDLLKNEYFRPISIDIEHTDQLVRLLDTVVIKLEGGTDEDLKILDEKPEPPPPVETNDKPIEILDDKVENIKKEAKDSDDEDDKPKDDKKPDEKKNGDSMEVDSESKDTSENINSNTNKPDSTTEFEGPPPPVTNPNKRKRSRDSSGSSSGSSSSSSSSSDSSDSEGEGNRRTATASKDESLRPPGDNDSTAEEKPNMKPSEDDSNIGSDQPNKNDDKSDSPTKNSKSDNKNDQNSDTKKVEAEKKERKEMHKTTSIFLRNLSPTITKAEVEAMCKRYGGFLRVALADPLPDRRWFRRGWVSFRREANIKDICWNLNNIRLKDCELGAIVNRDLSKRIRPVNGITLHKQITRADARLAARLCYHLDARANLWNTKVINTQGDIFSQFDLQSSNPVLHNITEYLIEEASAEEEELLGLTTNGNGESTTTADGEVATIAEIERDPQLTAVLDKLILYLRIVHSVDYYNHCEYPYEDEMPNRCGIMHARGPQPSNKPSANDISEYVKTFEGKMSSFLQETQTIDEDELVKLGTKDPQEEVEKFIFANTQELAKDKWLCPLSGKKFKGPDFIRKHIFNKHGEKVDEVKKEVEYFNNYLRDIKRPQLQEHSSSGKRSESSQSSSFPSSSLARGSYPGYHPPYGYPPAAYPPPAPYPSSRHMRSYNRGRGPVSDFRPVIHYRDLDAPREPEDFI